jgi:hypothetical protein
VSEHTNTVDLAGQIKKIADHLVFLEKKLDTLLEEVQNRGNKEGAASFAPRPSFSRPFRPAGAGGGKGGFRPSGDRPYNARPSGDRPYSARPQGAGARPYSARPSGDRPYNSRPSGDRPYNARPSGDRPRNFHRGASQQGGGARPPQTKTWRPNKDK